MDLEYMRTASGRAAMELGSRLGRLGTLTVGAGQGGLAWMLARCAGCGAALAGADVLFHDGSTPACGAWLARRYRFPAALYFLEAEGGAAAWLCDGRGKPLGEDRLPPCTDWAGVSGSWDRLCGADSAYAAHAVGDSRVLELTVTVMDLPGQKPLRMALERLGCEVLERPRPGVPLLQTDQAGFALTVRDGLLELRPAGRDALSAAVDWCLRRGAKPLSVPAFSPEQKNLYF